MCVEQAAGPVKPPTLDLITFFLPQLVKALVVLEVVEAVPEELCSIGVKPVAVLVFEDPLS
jgi:hypothetical protein